MEQTRKIPALVINRAVDNVRLEKTRQELERLQSVEVIRVEAVDGYADGFDVNDHMPSAADFRCNTPEKVDWRTTAAVFLSHARCWETVIQKDMPYALICEDDIAVNPSNVWILEAVRQLHDFDVVFVNDRMVKHRRMLGDREMDGDFVLVDENHMLAARTMSKKEFEHPKLSDEGKLPVAPGGDGYFVSRRGAEKLLGLFCLNRRFEHADMFLYTASVSSQTFDNAAYSPKRYARINAQLERNAELMSFVSREPLITHRPGRVGGSVRMLWKRQAAQRATT